ncbi:MAG: hypothetical protein ACYDCK_04280 [Thermoplasmatota archaeon]
MRFAALVAVAVMLACAGCLKSAATNLEGLASAHGDATYMSEGWSYDAKSLIPVTGTISVDVNDRSNTGTVSALIYAGADTWRVDWTDFHAFLPFHDGGIARNLIEHGDSGTGDKSIPKLHLLVAGWGYATVHRNGDLIRDPTTGSDVLKAHFMFTDGRVRDANGTIENRLGTGAYSPANASDGRIVPGGNQLFLQLTSDDPTPPPKFILVFEADRALAGAS